jgi:hypothetical protein
MLILKTATGVTVFRVSTNRYRVTLPYGRFGETVWLDRSRDAAMNTAATYLAR